MKKIACVDLFCGAGGLTHGFVLEGLPVIAGIDPACHFPYEVNNKARFIERDISKVTTDELEALFGDAELKVLTGCAPCQPFSTYTQRYDLDGKDGMWRLLYQFARLAKGSMPDVITMENVPAVAKHEVFAISWTGWNGSATRSGSTSSTVPATASRRCVPNQSPQQMMSMLTTIKGWRNA